MIVCAHTLDRWQLLTSALQSISQQVPPPGEIILVVDHHAELFARASRTFVGVTVIENASVKGLSGARNTGLEAASGAIAAFLDDDAEADPGWLAALVEPYDDSRVIATGGKVIPVWMTARPSWMPEEFDWVVGCSYRGMPETKGPIRNPIGCSMSMRRVPAVEAGAFRTGLGRVGALLAGCEETELAIRMRRLFPGSEVVYVPASTVRHHLPSNRARWTYFRSRCFQEGRSKARLARFEGTKTGLASERLYAARVLPLGVLRGIGELLRGDRSGAARSAAIVAGLCITVLGYVSESVRARAPVRLAAS